MTIIMKILKPLLLIILATVLAACVPAEKPVETTYKDGVYFASEEEFSNSGWKYHVVVTVADGKISDLVWNATSRVPGQDKITMSMDGNYGIVAFGNAQAEWHEQAESAEAYLIESQSPYPGEDFYIDDQGHTDAIAGVSINVTPLFNLVQEALASNPVPEGMYEDGYPMSHLEPDDNGWQFMSQFTVVNGTIVDANFNEQSITEVDVYDNPLDKKGMGYDYGLKEKAGAEYEWFEQANMAGDYVVENQAFDVNYSDDSGHTDSIAGVTISVSPMAELFDKAFE